MDMAEFFKRVDAQIREAAAKEKKPSERRQQQVPVAEERRSGLERRGISRALTALVGAVGGCGGNCEQGRGVCTCRDK